MRYNYGDDCHECSRICEHSLYNAYFICDNALYVYKTYTVYHRLRSVQESSLKKMDSLPKILESHGEYYIPIEPIDVQVVDNKIFDNNGIICLNNNGLSVNLGKFLLEKIFKETKEQFDAFQMHCKLPPAIKRMILKSYLGADDHWVSL